MDVEKVQNIPNDYEGVIGVPLSYLSYYCPKQFKDDELYIIAGTDIVKEIHNWKNYDEEIAPYFKVIEITRNNQYTLTKDKSIILYAPAMDVSSTLVRTMLQNGQNPYPYITSSICDSIKTYKFYTDNQEESVKKWFKNFKG